MSEIAQEKEQLRQLILSARKIPFPEHAELLTENLLKLVIEIQPKRVAIYQSYPSEPRTLDFIASSPVPVVVPITEPEGNLSWVELETGIPTKIAPGDLMLIPALAVDRDGNRLGRGKGYFDRELEKLEPSVPVYAVIFEREFLERIPIGATDRPVKGVISEVQIREIN